MTRRTIVERSETFPKIGKVTWFETIFERPEPCQDRLYVVGGRAETIDPPPAPTPTR